MSRYQFDDVSDSANWSDVSIRITHFIVRGLGFFLMIVGLWIGLKAINEAWALYKQPHRIERFAVAIEQGSNLDKTLASSQAKTSGKEGGKESAEKRGRTRDIQNDLGFRLSYFAAWLLAILLLMLVGRLSIAAIKTGGELALYDMQIKKFAKLLIEESKKSA